MSAGPTTARRLQVTIVVVVACILAWLSFLSAAVRILPSGSPILSIFVPDLPESVLQNSIIGIQTGRGEFAHGETSGISRAASARPLDERPFFLLALRALSRNDRDSGIALLEEARRRNPRFRIARVLLLDQWLKAGDVKRAGAEMAVLFHLLPGAQSLLVSELAHLAMQPATSSSTRNALAGEGALLDAVLAAMSRQGASPSELLRFAGPSAPAGLQPGGWRRTLIDSLVLKGDYATARSIWADAAGISLDERALLVFDGAMNGRTAPAPFNWTLAGNEVGATTVRNKSMIVEFYGRVSGVLAGQLLLLPPGTYRLRITTEDLESGEGSTLSWAVTCADAGGVPPLQIVPVSVKPSARTVLAPFVVPKVHCGAQWIRLNGSSGEFSSPTTARFGTISIERQS